MLDSDTSDDPHLVAGRTCGSCNVCCVELTIDDPELQKVQGYCCPHTQRDNSCGIYATRPHTCRAFYCGWRRLKWIREPLKPDRSGVLVRLHGEISKTDGTKRLGVEFTLLNAAALKAEGLAEFDRRGRGGRGAGFSEYSWAARLHLCPGTDQRGPARCRPRQG